MVRRLLLWFSLIPLLLFITGLLLHPYLSVTDPTGAGVAVVEGWIPPELMPQVKAEIERRGYERIYTTGTIRPFAYWLRKDRSITVALPKKMEGGVRIVTAGLPGVHLIVMIDGDTAMVRPVKGDTTSYWLQPDRPFSTIRIASIANGAASDVDVLFTKDLFIRGSNVHSLASAIWIEDAGGNRRPGSPTYAHHAAEILSSGPNGREVTPVPAMVIERGRTRANAEAFAKKAIEDEITSVDIISMGVHARRSRRMYQSALGEQVQVGVISIPDPEALRGSWWRTPLGWSRLLKEMVGMPIAAADTDGR